MTVGLGVGVGATAPVRSRSAATGAVVAVMANSDLTGPDGEAVSMRGKAAIEAAGGSVA